MSKCPECKKEIEYLDNFQSGQSHYRLYSDGEYDYREFIEDGKVNDYKCPECGLILFRNEEDTIKFLSKMEAV